jgi:hypothetical protein
MRPRRSFVHVGVAKLSILTALLNQVQNLFRCRHILLRGVLDVDSLSLVLADLQIALLRVEKVSNTLLVNFYERDLQTEFYHAFRLLNLPEDFLDDTRHESPILLGWRVRSHACICFAGCRLPVGEGRSVNPFEYAACQCKYLLMRLRPTISKTSFCDEFISKIPSKEKRLAA